ncbi:rCG29838 [Rattus norvegicus]|uniref:RCG29838 n=1 Tax=Rattus norvegicus TaxID=10116 RepID=A6IN43_RAT|nr:rCG29838 [Rattus norvegicus]
MKLSMTGKEAIL